MTSSFNVPFPPLTTGIITQSQTLAPRSLNYFVSFRSCGETPKTQTERTCPNKMTTASRLLVGRATKETAMKPTPKLSTLHHKQTGGPLKRNISTQRDFSRQKATKTNSRSKRHTRTSRKYGQSDNGSVNRSSCSEKTPTVSHLHDSLFVAIKFYKPLSKVFHPLETQQNKPTRSRNRTENDANPQGKVHPGGNVLSIATNLN